MKKAITLSVITVFLFFASCNKQVAKQEAFITTNPALTSGSTGITLSAATTLAQHFLQGKNPNSTVTIRNAQTIIKNGVMSQCIFRGS